MGYPNVIILTTSNITGAIDLAFVDRADIKQYIGPPSPRAIYSIYKDCLTELMEKKVITMDDLEDFGDLSQAINETNTNSGISLTKVSEKSYGLSGRTLRKIPFLAHALFVRTSNVSLKSFLTALDMAVEKQLKDRERLSAENLKQNSQVRKSKHQSTHSNPENSDKVTGSDLNNSLYGANEQNNVNGYHHDNDSDV